MRKSGGHTIQGFCRGLGGLLSCRHWDSHRETTAAWSGEQRRGEDTAGQDTLETQREKTVSGSPGESWRRDGLKKKQPLKKGFSTPLQGWGN